VGIDFPQKPPAHSGIFLRTMVAPTGHAKPTRAFVRDVYAYMALGLFITGTAAYLAERSGFYVELETSRLLLIVSLAAPLSMLLLLSYRIERMKRATAHISFWSYALLMGLSFSGLLEVYAQTSVARAFLISGAMFGAMSAYSYITTTDLSRFGSLLLMGLIGIIIVGLANLVFVSPPLQVSIEAFGIILFAALTAYDTQYLLKLHRLRRDVRASEGMAIIGALALYLDFINLFATLLQLRRLGFSLVRYSHRMAAWSRLFVMGDQLPKKTLRQSAAATFRWLRSRVVRRKTRTI